MANLFLDKEKYQEYVAKKEASLKERHIIKTIELFGGEEPYKKQVYDINEFEEMPQQYGIRLEYYKYNDETKRYWDIIKVTVLEDKKDVFSFIRDYSSISLCYAHNKNMDYLVFTGENYQGFSVFNLTKKTFFSDIDAPFGWCPTEIISYDEDDNILRAYGCPWGGDFSWRDYRIEDLDNPDFSDYESTPDD